MKDKATALGRHLSMFRGGHRVADGGAHVAGSEDIPAWEEMQSGIMPQAPAVIDSGLEAHPV